VLSEERRDCLDVGNVAHSNLESAVFACTMIEAKKADAAASKLMAYMASDETTCAGNQYSPLCVHVS